jgi:predicted DNA-binding protein YlxM (UPF0122 family)
MDQSELIEMANLSAIITQKLNGIVNKLDISGSTKEDKKLSTELRQVLEKQQEIANKIKDIHES